MALEISRAAVSTALTPSSSGKDRDPILGPGVPLHPSTIAGGIRTFTLAGTTVGTSLNLIFTGPVPRAVPNPNGHPNQREEFRFSPLGRIVSFPLSNSVRSIWIVSTVWDLQPGFNPHSS